MRQPATEPVQSIQAYHERTKHRLTGYARGPDMLDWDDQPDPFRRYEGAEVVELPISSIKPSRTYRSLWSAEASGQQIYQTNLNGLSCLLELSLALSAWKQMGDSRWSMRCNPSSGNLHPTEAYVIACGLDGLPDGIYHYRTDLHALEKRCTLSKAERKPCLLMGFSSVHWREAWKYGERSFRYCQHDVGHALAAVGFASKTIGWKAQPISIGDNELSDLLGLNQAMPAKAEREHPDCLLALVTPEQPGIDTASINLNFICSSDCGI